MVTPPVLEDSGYAGRGGGYIARITGKLLYEAATGGQRHLFFPAPKLGVPGRVYAGADASAPPLYDVPAEFYSAMVDRIERIYGIEYAEYDGVPYTFMLRRPSDAGEGMVLSIARLGNS